MTRAILYLIAFVLVIGVLRSVLGIIYKAFSGLFAAAPSTASAPRNVEQLKKDPVCGTFVPPSTAVQKTVGGETYYFCSAACRDKFQVGRA